MNVSNIRQRPSRVKQIPKKSSTLIYAKALISCHLSQEVSLQLQRQHHQCSGSEEALLLQRQQRQRQQLLLRQRQRQQLHTIIRYRQQVQIRQRRHRTHWQIGLNR